MSRPTTGIFIRWTDDDGDTHEALWRTRVTPAAIEKARRYVEWPQADINNPTLVVYTREHPRP